MRCPRPLCCLAMAAAVPAALLHAQRHPATGDSAAPAGQWTMTGGDYALTRYTPLDQVNPETVARLRPAWGFSTGTLRAHEGNPLVVGSVLYLHTPYPNAVYALDLSQPGAPIKWKYSGPMLAPTPPSRAAPPPPTGCCDVGSRGLAWHPSGKIFVPLLAGELAALNAETGREIWRVRNADARTGATLSGAPLVVRDLVIVGVSGAEYGVRGHLSAYDALTGKLIWRGWSTGPDADVLLEGRAASSYPSHQGQDLGVSSWSGDAWRQGGGTTPGWIAYDPVLDLIYYGTDQPAPANPEQRPGDNKWTSTIFARDPATGKVRWALQITPHDEWGYGAANESILADLTVKGEAVKALVHFARNGFAYTIDRGTGRILVAEKYGPANWARGVDLATGLPQVDPRFAVPPAAAGPATPASPVAARGARVPPPPASGICPAAIGAKYLQPAAFSPLTRLFYVPAANLCMDIQTAPATYTPGLPFSGATVNASAGPGGTRGRFIAWDASTASIAWEIREPLPVASGVLATGGGLVFYGTLDGWLKAVDQRSGRELWKFKTPSGIVGNPIAFLGPDGREYVAVLSGVGGWWGLGGNGALTDLAELTNPGGVLLVFGL